MEGAGRRGGEPWLSRLTKKRKPSSKLSFGKKGFTGIQTLMATGWWIVNFMTLSRHGRGQSRQFIISLTTVLKRGHHTLREV